jgi:hypothetical protein
MNMRKFALVLALLAVIAIPFGLVGPTKPDTASYNTALAGAIVDDASNNVRADGAPQQAVVNGWVARDLAIIQIRQNNDLLALTHMMTALMVALVLAVIITAAGGPKKNREAEIVSAVVPQAIAQAA